MFSYSFLICFATVFRMCPWLFFLIIHVNYYLLFKCYIITLPYPYITFLPVFIVTTAFYIPLIISLPLTKKNKRMS